MSSKFTKEEQTEIVRLASSLSIAISTESSQLNKLKGQHFRPAPPEPRPINVNPNVNPVAPDYSNVPKIHLTYQQYLSNQCLYNPTLETKIFGDRPIMRGLVAAALGFVIGTGVMSLATSWSFGLLIFAVFMFGAYAVGFAALPLAINYNRKYTQQYMQVIKEANGRLMTSPDYIKAKAIADQIANERYQKAVADKQLEIKKANELYQSNLKDYKENILPAYFKDKSNWEAHHKLKIEVLSKDLSDNANKLNELYDTTQLISASNRSIDKLVWLYRDMSTSEHDIERAIDLLNDAQKINLLQSINGNVQELNNNMMTGMEAIYKKIDSIDIGISDMQDSIDDVYSALRKTRRDMNIGNIVHGYQNYKFSKEFSKFREKFV